MSGKQIKLIRHFYRQWGKRLRVDPKLAALPILMAAAGIAQWACLYPAPTLNWDHLAIAQLLHPLVGPLGFVILPLGVAAYTLALLLPLYSVGAGAMFLLPCFQRFGQTRLACHPLRIGFSRAALVACVCQLVLGVAPVGVIILTAAANLHYHFTEFPAASVIEPRFPGVTSAALQIAGSKLAKTVFLMLTGLGVHLLVTLAVRIHVAWWAWTLVVLLAIILPASLFLMRISILAPFQAAGPLLGIAGICALWCPAPFFLSMLPLLGLLFWQALSDMEKFMEHLLLERSLHDYLQVFG